MNWFWTLLNVIEALIGGLIMTIAIDEIDDRQRRYWWFVVIDAQLSSRPARVLGFVMLHKVALVAIVAGIALVCLGVMT